MSDEVLVADLKFLASPGAEAMSDSARLTAFVEAGIDAIAAVERLTQERDELRDKTRMQAKDNFIVRDAYKQELKRAEAAERKVEKLREALAFYARHTVYQTSTVYMSGARGPTEIERDGGDRARAALTGVETSNVDRG